jgi:ribosomal protein L6P/L9E
MVEKMVEAVREGFSVRLLYFQTGYRIDPVKTGQRVRPDFGLISSVFDKSFDDP